MSQLTVIIAVVQGGSDLPPVNLYLIDHLDYTQELKPSEDKPSKLCADYVASTEAIDWRAWSSCLRSRP